MFKAIPNTQEPKAYDKISPVLSKFICLSDGEYFDVKMQYSKLNFKKAVKECYVRKEVFERLKLAQSYLPEGYKLRIWDAWRPFELQEELYENYSQKIIEQFNLKGKTFEEKQKIIQKYISFPEKNKNSPAVHTTGGAIDVTLIDKNGKELDMGTEFDEFSEKTRTNYYEENEQNNEIRNNRRMLYNCMISAGFTNLPSEWWHYDFGDKFWAFYNNDFAIYTGVYKKTQLSIKK